jgi:NDP-sugar pyrophosphorylase family protein
MPKISAMIFAAGLGTRLYPLTADKPKALVPYQGKPLLEWAIQKLLCSGINHIVINTHHFSEQIIDYVQSQTYAATIQISNEAEQLMDTAGGLKLAASLFAESDHILLYNVDIISTIDLESFINHHITSDHLATLAVRARETSRYFLFDENTLHLCGWKNEKTGEIIWSRETDSPISLGFSGIHMVRKEILALIPENQKLSFTPLYIELATQYPIFGYLHNQDDWKDMGKWEDFNTN